MFHYPTTTFTYRGMTRHTEVERLPIRPWEEAYLPLFFTMLTRWRIAFSVLLPLNWSIIHFQGLPSFLHASRRSSCTGSHGEFARVLKLWPSLLEHNSLSLLKSGSLSLQGGSLPCNIRFRPGMCDGTRARTRSYTTWAK